MFDADAGCEARARAKGKKEEKIEDELKNHAKQNREILRYFGLAEEDFPAGQVRDHVANFKDHLEEFLVANWPEWDASCKSVEDAAGIDLTKNHLAYRTATLNAEGVVPEMLTQVLAKAQGL